LNTKDEGAFNAIGMVEWMRKTAQEGGVDYINNEVIEMVTDGSQIQSIKLSSGESISVNSIVNAAGTRAAQVSRLAGIDLPIEARRRYTYIFSVDDPLPQDLPLTIDPTGVHFRSYGPKDYLVGCPPIGPDVAVDVDDFSFAENAWDEKILPIITHRIPQFNSARITSGWAITSLTHSTTMPLSEHTIVWKTSTFVSAFLGMEVSRPRLVVALWQS
jgi:glycine/D-amino acid oxidase-like deaminating enzyme